MQIVGRLMKQQGSGTIVNMASTNGLVGETGLAAYNASRFGVVGLTMTAAIELAQYGIRVNAATPGSAQSCRVPCSKPTRNWHSHISATRFPWDDSAPRLPPL